MTNYHNLLISLSFILFATIACTNPRTRGPERETVANVASTPERSTPTINTIPASTPHVAVKAVPVSTPTPLRTVVGNEQKDLAAEEPKKEIRSGPPGYPLSENKRSSESETGYITGPRGGCYYWNRNGRKTYVDHSYCGR